MAFFRLFALKFRLFAWWVSSFRMALFRFFVFSHGFLSVFSFFRMVCFSSFHLSAWCLFAAKRRKDEMAQSSHHSGLIVTLTLGMGTKILCMTYFSYSGLPHISLN